MTTIESHSAGVNIENLYLSFDDTEVLKGINLSIKSGEFFAFLGPSGSGKSTLLRAIAGFGPTPSGRILIGDDEVVRLQPWKRNVGMVFQSYALWPHMTVRKNVAFGLEERKTPAKIIRKKVDEALDLVGLLELAERRPSQISGGQQQRVALARTIVVEPRVLLLDEPLSNLDANLRVQMRRELRDLQRRLNLTTIFVTHDQEEANTTSDRMAVLNDGIIQQIGTPMELYDRPENLFVANFLGTANVIEGTVDGVAGGALFRSRDGYKIPVDTPARGPCSVVFRPQHVLIGEVLDKSSEGRTKLSGTVKYTEFLGNTIRYAIEVGSGTILVDDSHQYDRHDFAVGANVGLFVDQHQVQVLKA